MFELTAIELDLHQASAVLKPWLIDLLHMKLLLLDMDKCIIDIVLQEILNLPPFYSQKYNQGKQHCSDASFG